ncbi:MAG: FxsA family protein [Actinomycetota bacterium]
MMPLLIVLLIAVPFLELFVIVQVAEGIGIFPTIVLLLVVSIAGGWLLKQQGTATWRRMRATMQRGEMPTDEATDGALILLGGALLLTPGFVTDFVGLAFLVPPSRRIVKRGARRTLGAIARRRSASRSRRGSDTSRSRRAVYDASVTNVRRKPSDPSGGSSRPPVPPQTLPSSERRVGEDDSPDTG